MLIDFRDLFKKYNLSFNGVLHVGANVGEEAPVYRELGIHKQIWIEPNIDLIERLKANVMRGDDKYVFNLCAGDENKAAVLHIANNGGQSSSVLELGTHAHVHPEVRYIQDQQVIMVRLEDLFTQEPEVIKGVDFLNIDVQGFELQVLQGLGRVVDQMKAIYLEINKEELYKGCALIDSIDLFMTARRFRRVETLWVGATGWGDAFYLKD